MNNMLRMLLFGLLCGAAACSAGGTSKATTSKAMAVELDFKDRTYELGETIDATLSITGQAAVGNTFRLYASCTGGEASATVQDTELEWCREISFEYEIVNEKFSSKVLHLAVTPTPAATAQQILSISLRISSADGTAVARADMELAVENTAPILPRAHYTDTPVMLEELFDFTLAADKEGYTGDFTVTPSIDQGNGYFIIEGKSLPARRSFTLPHGAQLPIRYQPMAGGEHEIRFTITDGLCSAREVVPVDVTGSDGSLAHPENGVYIFSNDLYYPAPAWKQEWAEQAEGVAILTQECRFLLAPKPVTGVWSRGKVARIEGLTAAATAAEARKDFDGRRNTEALLQALDAGTMSKVEFAEKCYRYDPAQPGRWYLPAAGQMFQVLQHNDQVTRCLELIGGRAPGKKTHYLTSTGADDTHTWCITAGKLDKYYFYLYADDVRAYPVRDLPQP